MYRIMRLGHEVLAGDAVLWSGFDAASSVVGELFWRSFDAHELQQEVRFLRRSLQERVTLRLPAKKVYNTIFRVVR